MPFLLASASIQLAPGVHREPGMLVDAQHNRFPLNGAGEAICDIARSPASLRVIVDELSAHLGLDRSECETEVHRFVSDLRRRRLVSVHQSLTEEAQIALALLPIRISSLRRGRGAAADGHVYRHYPATALGVVRGCLEAHQGSMWMLLLFALSVGLATTAVGAPTAHLLAITVRALVLAVCWYALLYWTSLVVHELSHLLVARLCGAGVASIYVRRGATGLLFRAPSRAAGRAVVVAGAAGALVYLSGALLVILGAPAEFWTTAALDQLRLSGVVAVCVLMAAQLLWLTPLTRDGRELWSSFRRAHDIRVL